MPVFILLRSLVIRLLSSRLAGSLAQFLRRSLSTGAAHLGTALRHIWDRVRSQESKEAVLGCVLCILNMHKKIYFFTRMSESIVRKVQPFTIGTRLSVPSVTKCQEFPQSYLPSEALDNCVLQRNLNSLYLSTSQVCAHGSRLVLPTVDQTAPVKIQPEHVAAEDHLNQNIASPSAVSRSIKKITISGSKDQSDSKTVLGPVTCSTLNRKNAKNCGLQLILTKIFLKKELESKEALQVKQAKKSGEKNLISHFISSQAIVTLVLKESLKSNKPGNISQTENKTCGVITTQKWLNRVFTLDVMQAEAWMKSKLQDLKDGCNVQHRPLHDWEEASQTLHRDLKDFENTLIQLNQLGEQLICKLNPTSDLVKKQLSQLREQWQTLKQTAANQTHALGGARSLQEFDRKVDKLEAWIKEKKEEEQSLVSVLGENVDKMQLTRRILDLKQDEQLHRNLHEEINNLALKLEKLGKADGKNITIRKKHINKMWLKVQSYLKNYHENLQVALEISSFYQQADNTLDAINNMRRSMPASKDLDTFGDREIRDIAGQIMMLDVSVSQLPKLHPGLAAGVTKKQAEVKDCWALLQRDLRYVTVQQVIMTLFVLFFSNSNRVPGNKSKLPESDDNKDKETKRLPQEGHGLVRAQHPGSARIEEFLSQLEVLWEELRRRHQRNVKGYMQVVKVLQALGSLEAWLESVELSMKASAIAGDPETMSRAERESCLLEKEVAARGVELSALRQEVDRLHGHSHPHTRGLAVRMEELERKYHCVLSALTLQSSKLQDTRMLTEFLEHPRHSDISSVPTLLGLQSSGVGDNQIETMGDPVEELREAVEMLNDTVRERGRSQSHDHAIRELLSKTVPSHEDLLPLQHASLAVCVEECLCSSKELSLEILEKETDMAVQCEPDRCGFGPLQDRLGHLESDYEIMKEDVKKMENQALRLKDLCPEKAYTFEVKTQSTLQAWSKLGKSVMDNRSRLQEFVELQGFFRSYLAMISWTEDTRSRIFSDTALHLRREGQRPLAAELDIQIELKFNEFDELAAKAKTLLNKEHHLTQMVKERMEELRSMLGWISVHWRAQKQQWLHKQNREEPSHDNIYSEATMWNSFKELDKSKKIFEVLGKKCLYLMLNCTFGNTEDSQVQVLDLPAGTDEMLKETSEPIHRVIPFSFGIHNFLFSPRSLPQPAVPQSSACSKVSLCCIFSSSLRNSNQWVKSQQITNLELMQLQEISHRVERYYVIKESCASDSPTLWPSASSSCSSQSSPVTDPQTTNVGFRPTTGSGSSSIFCSLKRMSKKRKRQRDERRHTIQRILDVDEQTSGMQRYDSETVTYNTQTWPLKEGQRKKSLQKNRNVAGTGAYMKNPLLKDIDSKCSGENSITPYAVSSGPTTSPSEAPGRSHCRVLSLGSVLSFDLPKDMTLIPSIQEIITIAPPESKKADATYSDPLSQRKTVLSSFRQTHVLAAITGSEISSSETQELIVAAKDLPDEEVSLQPSSLEDPCAGSEEKDEISSDTKSTTNEISPPSKPPIYMNQVHNCCSVPHKHECLSVHTLIRDLNGHQFHKCTKSQCEHENSARLKSNQASLVRVNLKSTMSVSVRQDSVDSGISTSSSFKLCTDAPCPDQPRPKGVVGKLISLEVGGIDPTTRENYAAFSSSSPESVNINTEPVHVDHQQFEEEEEELEDIWKQNTNYRQSICSDIMYQPNQTGDPLSSSPPVTEPPVLYRNLVTASEPNLLIAEFKLPPHIQNCLGYEKWQSSKDHLPPLATADRRSWAAFPNREPASKTAVMLNETASDPNQSMSLLSVNMGLNEACQKNLKDVAKPQSGKPEHQSMEGTLERKHKLQLGGKKAASRGWNSYHAVLYRHTLCFFQDRKDTLRYLFNTTSRFLMKKWIMKIQASTGKYNTEALKSIKGQSELMSSPTNVPGDQAFPISLLKQQSSDQTKEIVVLTREQSHMLQSQRADEKSKTSSLDPGCCECSLTQTVTHRLSVDNTSPSSSHSPATSSQNWLSSKHRSHSFTSATYQKIKPMQHSPGGEGVEKGSNYCVTLVVGGSSADSSSISRGLEPPVLPSPSWQPDVFKDSALKSYSSLPRPRNKSVFKKFFGKKEP
uniref:PH domain-containing protein n=1 Tax=Poecilia formosa TaxID=48698 RepID=A0A096LZY1_POEFO